MSEPMYVLLKIYPDGTVKAALVADNEQEFLKALASWRELVGWIPSLSKSDSQSV